MVINERLLLLTLATIMFTHIVDFMVMMPLGPHFTAAFGISDAQFALLVSAYTLASGVSGVLASSCVDRFERKRLMLSLYLAFTLSTLACGLAPSYEALMAARIAAGLFGGVLGALTQTVVGDLIPFERRGRAMGVVMSAFSLATVAGVPASLWVAGRWGWHGSFIAIAVVSALVLLLGLRTLPQIRGHLQARRAARSWQPIVDVLRDGGHWRAFGFSAVALAAGFTTIPFLTIYMTANMGLRAEQLPMIYLISGVATFFSSRLIGRLSDRCGKVLMFRVMGVLAIAPILAISQLGQVPMALMLALWVAYFVLVSGRMVPSMAILTAAAEPRLRGAFMSLNASVQSAAMGLAALVGGLLIHRNADGSVSGFDVCGALGVALSLLSLWAVGRLRLHGQGQG